jgi:hypothetical protein
MVNLKRIIYKTKTSLYNDLETHEQDVVSFLGVQ